MACRPHVPNISYQSCMSCRTHIITENGNLTGFHALTVDDSTTRKEGNGEDLRGCLRNGWSTCPRTFALRYTACGAALLRTPRARCLALAAAASRIPAAGPCAKPARWCSSCAPRRAGRAGAARACGRRRLAAPTQKPAQGVRLCRGRPAQRWRPLACEQAAAGPAGRGLLLGAGAQPGLPAVLPKAVPVLFAERSCPGARESPLGRADGGGSVRLHAHAPARRLSGVLLSVPSAWHCSGAPRRAAEP